MRFSRGSVNDENVEIFKQYGAKTLHENSVTFGWDVIDDILDNIISDGHFIKPCDGWVKMPDSNCFVAKKSERIYTVLKVSERKDSYSRYETKVMQIDLDNYERGDLEEAVLTKGYGSISEFLKEAKFKKKDSDHAIAEMLIDYYDIFSKHIRKYESYRFSELADILSKFGIPECFIKQFSNVA